MGSTTHINAMSGFKVPGFKALGFKAIHFNSIKAKILQILYKTEHHHFNTTTVRHVICFLHSLNIRHTNCNRLQCKIIESLCIPLIIVKRSLRVFIYYLKLSYLKNLGVNPPAKDPHNLMAFVGSRFPDLAKRYLSTGELP